MFPNPDFSTRRIHAGLLTLAAATAVALAGCSAGPSRQDAGPAGQTAAQSAAGDRAARANATPTVTVAKPAPPAETDTIVRMLAYAERVRVMPPAELGQELARLGDAATPTDQLRLSLVLSQLHQLPDLIRAQELLARVLGNADAEAQALQPLARLLASRFGEQRRLEEQLEKQNQQMRDVQRRLDQTNERLEALKAIERSLASRPPAAPASAPAPATNRGRSAAP